MIDKIVDNNEEFLVELKKGRKRIGVTPKFMRELEAMIDKVVQYTDVEGKPPIATLYGIEIYEATPRKVELQKIKEIIKEKFDDYSCGIYNSRNIVGDPMHKIFNGKYFRLDGYYHYSYYELFGTTDEEFKEVKDFYNTLRKWSD